MQPPFYYRFLLLQFHANGYFTDPGVIELQDEKKEDGDVGIVPIFEIKEDGNVDIPIFRSMDLDEILLEEPREITAELHRESKSSREQKGEV